MLLESLARWTFSISNHEKEKALMIKQNFVIYLNRLAYLENSESEKISGSFSGLTSSSNSQTNLDSSYYMVDE